MMNRRNLALTMKNVFVAGSLIFSLTQCSEEEIAQPEAAPETLQAAAPAASAAKSVSSLTISGVNAAFATATDCKTCSYVVPEGSTLVDARALGLKAGSVICLNSIFNYGALEIINVEGTEESPIVITTVGENLADPTVEATSTGDPY